jgi:hypothetical protein
VEFRAIIVCFKDNLVFAEKVLITRNLKKLRNLFMGRKYKIAA